MKHNLLPIGLKLKEPPLVAFKVSDHSELEWLKYPKEKQGTSAIHYCIVVGQLVRGSHNKPPISPITMLYCIYTIHHGNFDYE